MNKEISEPLDASDLWEKYLNATMDERRHLVRTVVEQEKNEKDLRRLLFYFGSDRPAYLQVFRQWVVTKAQSMEKENGTLDYHAVSDILDGCRESTMHGVIYDVEKATIAYGTLISLYPEWGLNLPLNPHIFEEKTQKTEQNLKAFSESIQQRPFLVSFSMPVTYMYDEETDETKYALGYPQESLRKIEQEYLLMNGGHLADAEGSFDPFNEREPYLSVLSFSENGETANFSFFTEHEQTLEKRAHLIEVAREWLEGQLSDGFAEDMNRYSRLVGKNDMTPYFCVDQLQELLEAPVKFAGQENLSSQDTQDASQDERNHHAAPDVIR